MAVESVTEIRVLHRGLAVLVVPGLTPMPYHLLAVALIRVVQEAALGAVLLLAMQLNRGALAVLHLAYLAEVARELHLKVRLARLELLVDLVVAAVVGVILRRLVLVALVV